MTLFRARAHRRRPRRSTAIDVVMAIAVSGWGVYLIYPQGDSVASAAAMALLGIPLLGRTRAPLAALGLIVVGVWVNGLLFGSHIRCSAELPAFGFAAFAAARYATTTAQRVTIAVASVAFLVAETRYDPIMVWNGGLFLGIALAAGVVLSGDLVRRRDIRTEELRAHTVALQAQQQDTVRVAVQAERLRIGADQLPHVHDALDAVLAGVAATHGGLDRGEGPAGFRDIEDAGRVALAQLRSALGTLRSGGAPENVMPHPPDIADLDQLLAELGQPGTVHRRGTARPLSPVVELTAYRVVEQVLQAVDTARGPVQVVLAYNPDCLDVRVEGQAVSRQDPVTKAGIQAGLDAARARAALFDGTLTCAAQRGRVRVASRLLLPADH